MKRLDKVKFQGPPPKNDTVPIELVDLSLTSVAPITVTYVGGQQPELWDVHVALTPSTQSVGFMTLIEEARNSGAFNLSLSVLLR